MTTISGRQFGGERQTLDFALPAPTAPAAPWLKTIGGHHIHPNEWEDPGTIPPEHYRQSHDAQLALPGMEKSPQDHVDDLVKSLAHTGIIGGEFHGYSPSGDRVAHEQSDSYDILLHHESSRNHPRNLGDARLRWEGHGDELPGEIHWVGVPHALARQGIASGMIHTALKIANEHPEIAAPRNSPIRFFAGVKLSHTLLKQHGEPVY